MRRSLAAVHVVALALWLGSLVFSFLLAKTLFDLIKPVCPSCLKVTEKADLAACTTCGALHHASCRGCALEHEGPHVLGPPRATASVTSTSLGHWERVKVTDEKLPPERRLLWRLDATSNALRPERGEVPGACFELPRAGVGDALGRAFELAQAIAVAMAIASLLTVLLTPPGGALRLLRALMLVAALALAVYGLGAGRAIATKRLSLESTTVASEAVVKDFGVSHAFSSVAGVAEALFVLVALVLALERRETPAS